MFRRSSVISDAVSGLCDRAAQHRIMDGAEYFPVQQKICMDFIGVVSSSLTVEAFPNLPGSLSRLLRECLVSGVAEDRACQFWKDDFSKKDNAYCLFIDMLWIHTYFFLDFVDMMGGLVVAEKNQTLVYEDSMTFMNKSYGSICLDAAECSQYIVKDRSGEFKFSQPVYAEELILRHYACELPEEWLAEATVLGNRSRIEYMEEREGKRPRYSVQIPPGSQFTLLKTVGFAWDSILFQGYGDGYNSIRVQSRQLLLSIITLITNLLIHHKNHWLEIEAALPGNKYSIVERLLASFFLLTPICVSSPAEARRLSPYVSGILEALSCIGPHSEGYWVILHSLDVPRALTSRLLIGSADNFIQCLHDLCGIEKSLSSYPCTIAGLKLIRCLFQACPLPLWQLKWRYHSVMVDTDEQSPQEWIENDVDKQLFDLAQIRVLEGFLRYTFGIVVHHHLWPIDVTSDHLIVSRECMSIVSLTLDTFRLFNWPGIRDESTYDLNQGSALIAESINGIKVIQRSVIRNMSEAGLVPAIIQFLQCDMIEQKAGDDILISFTNAAFQEHIVTVEKDWKDDKKEKPKNIGQNRKHLLFGEGLDIVKKLLSICRENQLSPYINDLAHHLLEQTLQHGGQQVDELGNQKVDFIKSLFAYMVTPDTVLAEKAIQLFTETMTFWSHQGSNVILTSHLAHGARADHFLGNFLIDHIIAQVRDPDVPEEYKISCCNLLTIGCELQTFVFAPRIEDIIDACNIEMEEQLEKSSNSNSHKVHFQVLHALVQVEVICALQTKLAKGSYPWRTLKKLCNDVLTPRLRRPLGEYNATSVTLALLARCIVHLAALGLEVPHGASKGEKQHQELLELVGTLLADCKWFDVPQRKPDLSDMGTVLGGTKNVAPTSFFLPTSLDRQQMDNLRNFLVKFQLDARYFIYHRGEEKHSIDGIATGDESSHETTWETISGSRSGLRKPFQPQESLAPWVLQMLRSGSMRYGASFYTSTLTVQFVVGILKAYLLQSRLPRVKDLYTIDAHMRELSWRRSFADASEHFMEAYENLAITALDYGVRRDYQENINSEDLEKWKDSKQSLEAVDFLTRRVAPAMTTLIKFLRTLVVGADNLWDHPKLFSVTLRICTRLLEFPPFRDPAYINKGTMMQITPGMLNSGTQVKLAETEIAAMDSIFNEKSADQIYLLKHLSNCFHRASQGLFTSNSYLGAFPGRSRLVACSDDGEGDGGSYVDVCINIGRLLLALLPSIKKSTKGFEVLTTLTELNNQIASVLSNYISQHHPSRPVIKQNQGIENSGPRNHLGVSIQPIAQTVERDLLHIAQQEQKIQLQRQHTAALKKIQDNRDPWMNKPGLRDHIAEEQLKQDQKQQILQLIQEQKLRQEQFEQHISNKSNAGHDRPFGDEPAVKRRMAERTVEVPSYEERPFISGFTTVLCACATGILDAIQEREGYYSCIQKCGSAVLDKSRVLFSPGWTCPAHILEEMLNPTPHIRSTGFLLQRSWARRLDSVLHLLQGIANTTQGATTLIEIGVFGHLQTSQLLRWAALPASRSSTGVSQNEGFKFLMNEGRVDSFPSAYISTYKDDSKQPSVWRRPLHATWCHALMLIAKLVQQSPVAAERPVLDFIEIYQERFTYVLETGVHAGEMALLEEVSSVAKILGALPKHSTLTRKLLADLAKAFSFVMSNSLSGGDLFRPKTQLEKISGGLGNNISEIDTSRSAHVPSVFQQRAMYLSLDTFCFNIRGLLQMALSREAHSAFGHEMMLWAQAMDHVLEGGRRIFEFLNDLHRPNQFIRVKQQDEHYLESLHIPVHHDLGSNRKDLLPLSMFLVAHSEDKLPIETPKVETISSPGWMPETEIENDITYTRVHVLSLIHTGGQALGVAPETVTENEFQKLCVMALEMVGTLLFDFCTRGNSMGILNGFLNFLHELRGSIAYNLMSQESKLFFDIMDESLRSSLNLGTSDDTGFASTLVKDSNHNSTILREHSAYRTYESIHE